MLTYVEDYIEFLYGSLNKDGDNAPVLYRGVTSNQTIKLATYDKSPVSSMGSFCARARTENLESCLTDRQVELARKIVLKYRRQLQNIGITLPEIELELPLRHKVRSIDRTKYLNHDVENKQVFLKFPYDPKKVSALHDYTQTGAGAVAWDNATKQWSFDLTEGNIKKILELFHNEDLKMDETLEPIVVDVLNATPKDLPTFAFENGVMQLRNTHARAQEYLELVGWDQTQINKMPTWVSQAISLGLRLDESVIDYLSSHYEEPVVNILTNRKVTLPSNNQLDGPWYDALLKANDVLHDHPWVLHLSWWTNKTNWTPFKNMISYEEKDKNSFRVQKQFAELLQGLNDPIIVVDSVIGRDAVRNFIESNSLKVIYISDIG